MRRVTQVGLYPREPAATKAGMGLLPFLVVTAGEGGEVKLPEMEAVKKEMFGCLRGVKRPTVVKAKDWRTAYDSGNWMSAATPEMIWPEYKEVRAPEGDGGVDIRVSTIMVYLSPCGQPYLFLHKKEEVMLMW